MAKKNADDEYFMYLVYDMTTVISDNQNYCYLITG